ncbi:MAG: valine--tRNA ligase [Clostridium sp.]|nr:valine--tRNA ligase [Clostridium sp.]
MEKNYDFTTIERNMQDFWEEEKIYEYRFNDSSMETFSIDTPPPTVSGKLHIGHIFSYTQAEIIARFKRMEGFNVFYPFGFDDNGLPTERLVEKEEKVKAKDVERKEFTSMCEKVARGYEEDFKAMWKGLGFSVDWNLKYRTIDKDVEKISQGSFLELAKKGKAYMKESPVLWCTECQTSIAQAELETKEVKTTFNYLKFQVEDGFIEIATTRPELLNGCVCIFVNPDDDRYKSYIGKKAIVPLYNFEIPILFDEEVSKEKGTGAVMCATFGDSTDVQWYEKYKLPYKKVILANGRISKEVSYIGDMKVKAARDEIIRLLKEKGFLIKSEELIHTIAIHERCGKDIEIIPSKQWYIDVLTDKEKYLQVADEIKWHPEYMKERYISWVKNLKWDWCISRQRYFGVPFPVWYCKSCGKPIFAKEEELPIDPRSKKIEGMCSCGCTEFIPEEAVFDTWATSSLTPEINARFLKSDNDKNEFLPMSMRSQAHEIIRTWAFYTIVKSLYHTGEIPWKDIMICGFVLAKKGEKISKSKNNSGLEPRELIKVNSADAIRYWSANSKLGTDTFFGVEDLKISKRFITKLWNASKFAISHLQDYEKSEIKDLLPVDRWIIERVNETTKNVRELLNNYEIGSARHEIDDLFWKDFCDYYLEIVKDRLYKPEIHGEEERRSGQYALYYSLLNILKLYAIYVPHITEYIYQEFFRKYEETKSIHKNLWIKDCEVDKDIIAFGEILKDTIGEVRKYKSEKNLSMKTEIEEVIIKCTKKEQELFRKTEKDIKACCKTEIVKYDMY